MWSWARAPTAYTHSTHVRTIFLLLYSTCIPQLLAWLVREMIIICCRPRPLCSCYIRWSIVPITCMHTSLARSLGKLAFYSICQVAKGFYFKWNQRCDDGDSWTVAEPSPPKRPRILSDCKLSTSVYINCWSTWYWSTKCVILLLPMIDWKKSC